jgi:esterase/lipase
MEVEKERTVKNQKKVFQRHLFLITIISSMLIAGLIGYTSSQIAVNNRVSDPKEINTQTQTEFNTTTEYIALKNQVNEARNNSLKVMDTELPKISSDLEKYNEDINLLVENVEWLKDNLALIRDSIGKIDSAFTVVKGVNTFVDLPIVGNIGDNLSIKISTNLALTKIQLDEINSILLELENLTVLKKEMSDSIKS